jgi:hypothetical protein
MSQHDERSRRTGGQPGQRQQEAQQQQQGHDQSAGPSYDAYGGGAQRGGYQGDFPGGYSGQYPGDPQVGGHAGQPGGYGGQQGAFQSGGMGQH